MNQPFSREWVRALRREDNKRSPVGTKNIPVGDLEAFKQIQLESPPRKQQQSSGLGDQRP